MPARLPYLDRDQVPPEVQAVFDGLQKASGRVLNFYRLLAHHGPGPAGCRGPGRGRRPDQADRQPPAAPGGQPGRAAGDAGRLTNRRGRANGAAFVSGFVVGQAAAFLATALVGSAATADRPRGNEELAAGLELAFGLGLLALAWPERRSAGRVPSGGATRTERLLGRLKGLRQGSGSSRTNAG